jgi:histidyl-tRNA synthetase
LIYFQIEINSLGDIESRQKFNEALSGYLNKPEIKSKMSEKSQAKLHLKNLLSLLDSKDQRDAEVFGNCPIKIRDFLSDNSKTRYEELKSTLNLLDIKYVENPALVRGLEYYNDLCFEIKYVGDKDMAKDTILGGGRYDFLINDLQGKDFSKPIIPAVG